MRQVVRPPPPPGCLEAGPVPAWDLLGAELAPRSTSNRARDSNGRSQQGVQVQERLPGPSDSASIGGAASSR